MTICYTSRLSTRKVSSLLCCHNKFISSKLILIFFLRTMTYFLTLVLTTVTKHFLKINTYNGIKLVHSCICFLSYTLHT
jgi:hypothetical protein